MKRPTQNRKKIILGLTGGFGSGKTTVARMLKSPSVKIIDADKISHIVIKPQGKVYKKIIATFGTDILRTDKTIDRQKLARLAFNNKNKLKKLNRIMHPKIISIIKREIKSCRKKLIVLDTPLLIEAGLKKLVDKLIVVKINRKKQIERLRDKSSLRRVDILKRIAAQMPLSEKVRLADFVIDNSGTMEKTKKQVEKIRRLLWRS